MKSMPVEEEAGLRRDLHERLGESFGYYQSWTLLLLCSQTLDQVTEL